MISSITLRVNYSETDQMGVVYHANYLVWFDRARTELMRETGLTYKELEQRGVYLAVSEVRIRYRAPARYQHTVTRMPREVLDLLKPIPDPVRI